MAVADFDIGVGPTLAVRFQGRIGSWVLLALLCAFTLTTFDGGDIAPRIISAFLLLAAGFYFISPPGAMKLKLKFPGMCLLAMTAWGIIQTLYFPQKILVDGWAGVLFWFTAAVIVLVGASVFERSETAAEFRNAFVFFASGISVLDLLEQASRATRREAGPAAGYLASSNRASGHGCSGSGRVRCRAPDVHSGAAMFPGRDVNAVEVFVDGGGEKPLGFQGRHVPVDGSATGTRS